MPSAGQRQIVLAAVDEDGGVGEAIDHSCSAVRAEWRVGFQGMIQAAVTAATMNKRGFVMRFRTSIATSMVVLVLGALAVAPAEGTTNDRLSETAPEGTLDAEAQDARYIAQATGRPFEAVYAEKHRDLRFAQALASISTADEFAQAGKDGTGSGYWISFAGPVAASTLEPLGELVTDVQIIDDAPLSARERESVTSTAARVVQVEMGAESVQASLDDTGTAVTAIVTAASRPTPPDVTDATDAAEEAVEATSDTAAKVEVAIVQSDDGPTQEVLSGGTALGLGTTSQLACTAGFTVRNARTSATGLLTASHCPDNLNYESRDILRFEGHGDSAQLDEQWLSSSEAVHNQFISQRIGSTLIRRKVEAVAAPFVGMSVCKYGTVTFYGCSTVINGPTTTVNTNGVTYGNLWQTEAYNTADGDSGAPWYYGTTAFGIHYGDIPRDGASRSAFTSVPAIEAATDLRVLRQ
jgi:streptogrisin C